MGIREALQQKVASIIFPVHKKKRYWYQHKGITGEADLIEAKNFLEYLC